MRACCRRGKLARALGNDTYVMRIDQVYGLTRVDGSIFTSHRHTWFVQVVDALAPTGVFRASFPDRSYDDPAIGRDAAIQWRDELIRSLGRQPAPPYKPQSKPYG